MNIAMKFYDSTWPSPQKYREIIPSLFALCFINSNKLKTYTNIHTPWRKQCMKSKIWKSIDQSITVD